MTYSRPSRVKPPNSLASTRSLRGEAAAAEGVVARGADGCNNGIRPSGVRRRRTWSARRPRLSTTTSRATEGEQYAVFLRNVVGGPHEDATGPVDHAAFAAGGDQAHDFVVQLLAIARLVLRPDDQVDDEPLQAPVATSPQQLAHEVDVRQVADLQQHDRQVARDRVAPQAGLATTVRMITAGSARMDAFAKMIDPASRSNSWASASEMPNCCSVTWLCVHARSNTRSAIRRSW